MAKSKQEGCLSAAGRGLPRTEELRLVEAGEFDCVIGVDEAGRGPLCGPVVAGACVYARRSMDASLADVGDSKTLDEGERERLFNAITEQMVYGTCEVDNKRIDEINILQATFEAMTGAVDACLAKLNANCRSPPRNVHILVDGPKVPPQLSSRFACTPMVRGDGREFLIAAGSIVAKVVRDRIMKEIDKKFPMYNLQQHKGYPTAEHMHLVRLHGPCEFHRLTFAPIKHMKFGKISSKRKAETLHTSAPEGLGVRPDGLRRSARLARE